MKNCGGGVIALQAGEVCYFRHAKQTDFGKYRFFFGAKLETVQTKNQSSAKCGFFRTFYTCIIVGDGCLKMIKLTCGFKKKQMGKLKEKCDQT